MKMQTSQRLFTVAKLEHRIFQGFSDVILLGTPKNSRIYSEVLFFSVTPTKDLCFMVMISGKTLSEN